jgi:hypothetical protein
LFAICLAAKQLGDDKRGNPSLVAEYTEEEEANNQADEYHLLLHFVPYDNPKWLKSLLSITAFPFSSIGKVRTNP